MLVVCMLSSPECFISLCISDGTLKKGVALLISLYLYNDNKGLYSIFNVIYKVITFVHLCFHAGLKSSAAEFLVFTLTVTLVAYTATAMTMAISADQSVVALANIFMTITFVFMMVRDTTQGNM